MKDLTNANSLDQIKWIFNGAKKPIGKDGKAFKETMEKAIDKLPLKDGTPMTDDLVKKFGVKDSDELKNLIESKFGDIFKLVKK
ncbi:hypothetical protein EDL98_05250 [Ornithobacterium rhinotracheale]|nr:hypothetical protein [Ornithobacterium rhinotracheale]